MRLLFKQRFFSWFDSYDIYDDHSVSGTRNGIHAARAYRPSSRNVGG